MKLPYHRNNFGGTLGGPIMHDKAFFFFELFRSAPGTRRNGHRRCDAYGRSSAEGDFTQDSFILYNPNTSGLSNATWQAATPGTSPAVYLNQAKGRNASPNCQAAGGTLNCLNTSQLDPTAANFLNISNTIGVSVPLPNGSLVPASGGGKYIGVYNTPTDSDEYLGKYDENIGDKDHVTATYFFVKTKSTPSGGGNINWTGNQSAAAQTNVNLADVHTFSPSIANQTWLTFTRAMGGRTLIPVTGPANQTLASFGLEYDESFLIQGPAGLPYLNITATFNTGNPNAGPVTGSDNYELRDVVSMTKGKHSLSLGGEFALDKTMFLANLNNYGDVTFATSAPTSTGNAIGDFITGQTSAFEQDSTYVTHLSTWHCAAFRRTTTASRPASRPTWASAGTSIRLPSMPITGRRRLFPASNPRSLYPTRLPPLLRWYRRGTCSLGIRVSVAASSARRLPTFHLVSVLHGTRLETAKPRFAPRPASSSVPPAATSGTSPETPCRSPFATALATLHLSQICTVAPLTTSPAPLPAEASSRTSIRRPTPQFYPSPKH